MNEERQQEKALRALVFKCSGRVAEVQEADEAYRKAWTGAGLPEKATEELVGAVPGPKSHENHPKTIQKSRKSYREWAEKPHFEVFCDGPEPPLLDLAARQRARDPSLWQLAFIPAEFENSGMELETFDSFEAAEKRMNGLRSWAEHQEMGQKGAMTPIWRCFFFAWYQAVLISFVDIYCFDMFWWSF